MRVHLRVFISPGARTMYGSAYIYDHIRDIMVKGVMHGSLCSNKRAAAKMFPNLRECTIFFPLLFLPYFADIAL